MILSDKGLVEHMFKINDRYVAFMANETVFLKFNGEGPSLAENRRRRALIGLLPKGSSAELTVKGPRGGVRWEVKKIAKDQWSLVEEGETASPNWSGVDATQDLGDWLAY